MEKDFNRMKRELDRVFWVGVLGSAIAVTLLFTFLPDDRQVEAEPTCTCLEQIQGRTYTVGDVKVTTDKQGRLMSITSEQVNWENVDLKSQ